MRPRLTETDKKCLDERGIVEVVTISLRDFEALVKLAGIKSEDIVPRTVGPLVWHKDGR